VEATRRILAAQPEVGIVVLTSADAEAEVLTAVLLNRGFMREELGDLAAARRLIERALAIREKTLEPGDPRLLEVRKVLAEHCREGHGLTGAEARELCRRHGF
jgi:FAD/FMN-containing dehydrogenase